MERKAFLSLMGMSAAGLALSCFAACSKKDESSSPKTITADFTLDLNDPANAALKNNGGYLIKNGVIVAKTTAGDYIAVASACTHEGETLQYQGGSSHFYCSRHGSTFGNSGNVTNGPASAALQQFKTTLSGTSLRVFS